MNSTIQPQIGIELSFPSELGYELVAREAVVTFAERCGIKPERIEDLKTVLCEACINAIEHGNRLQSALRVQIFCRLEPGRLVVEVIDAGTQTFALPDDSSCTISDKIEGHAKMRGMGLFLIRQLSDEAGFAATNEHRNYCWFAFRIETPNHSNGTAG
jgi:serine/threonine-protein kinase RsbW